MLENNGSSNLGASFPDFGYPPMDLGWACADDRRLMIFRCALCMIIASRSGVLLNKQLTFITGLMSIRHLVQSWGRRHANLGKS